LSKKHLFDRKRLFGHPVQNSKFRHTKKTNRLLSDTQGFTPSYAPRLYPQHGNERWVNGDHKNAVSVTHVANPFTSRIQYGNVQWPNGNPDTKALPARVESPTVLHPKHVRVVSLVSALLPLDVAAATILKLIKQFGPTVLVFIHDNWKRIHRELIIRYGGKHGLGPLSATSQQIELFLKAYISKHFSSS